MKCFMHNKGLQSIQTINNSSYWIIQALICQYLRRQRIKRKTKRGQHS